MKLSEAIRLGAMTGPQTYGMLFNGDSSCALGAAYRAGGLSKDYSGRGTPIEKLWLAFPILLKRPTIGGNHALSGANYNGNCLLATGSIGDCIIALNDGFRWTREQIADWVAEQERILGYDMLPPEPEPEEDPDTEEEEEKKEEDSPVPVCA